MKAAIAVILMVLPVVSQTNGDFLQRYQSPKKGTYVVRPNIIMSVKFGDDSSAKDVCRAVIEPETTASSNEVGSEIFPSELALEIIDEVAPITQRGKLINSVSFNGGCTGMKADLYEEVTINHVTRCDAAGGGTYRATIKWKTNWCEDKKK